MDRSNRTQSILQMHESLARVVPSQAQMHLDVVGWVNAADGEDFNAHMVDYRAWKGIGNRLLRDLSQANEVRTALLFVCVQKYPLSLLTQTVGCIRIKAIKTIIFSSFHRIFLEKNIAFFRSGNFEAVRRACPGPIRKILRSRTKTHC